MNRKRSNHLLLGLPIFALLIVGGFIFLLLNGIYQMPWYEWFATNMPDWAAALNSIVMGISGIMAITRIRLALIVRGVFFVIFVLTVSLWEVAVEKAPVVGYVVIAVSFIIAVIISGLRKADKSGKSKGVRNQWH